MNDIMHLEFCWLGVFVALHPGLNLSLVSCNRCIIGLISWWLQIKIACILCPILCCTTYRHNSWMLTPFHVFPGLYAGSPVTDCFTVSWDLFIPLHSSFHHLPVWGEQAGSVCSLGPARAEDAALNMLAVSFFHLAYALLMALCPEFLGYSWPHLWPLRRHKHSFPHHLWDLSKFFFFLLSILLKSWGYGKLHSSEITAITGGGDPIWASAGRELYQTLRVSYWLVLKHWNFPKEKTIKWKFSTK